MVKHRTWFIILSIAYLFSSAATGSETTANDATSPDFAEQCLAIRQDAERKLASLGEKMRSELDPTINLVDHPDLVARYQARYQTQSEIILSPASERVVALVEPHAADSAAVEHLAWVAMLQGATDTRRAALELMTQHHLVRAETIDVAKSLSRKQDPLAKPLLRAQLSSADLPQDSTWRVMLSLAELLQREAAMASRLSSADDEELAIVISNLGVERVAELKNADVTAIEAEAITLFSTIEQKYPEQELSRGVTAGEFAKSCIFEMRNLRVGKLAPDIVGEDLNGEPLRLNDYRGKVVLLSFWATWCSPCMAEIPNERKLVELYNDRPFAIVGVNADIDNADVERSLDEFKISWRSFSCGPKGPYGPIPRAWNVSSWPTMYLIDHTGVIRGKSLRGVALETKLAELVPAAERAIRK